MRLQRHTLSIALAGLLASAASAQAQIGVYNRPQINPRPTVSPYLSIFRGNPAINYFGSVRPQIEMNRQLYQMQQEIQAAQPNLVLPFDPLQQGLGTTGMTTGHPVSFQNYSHYYGNRGGSAGVAGGVGGPTGFANPASPIIRPIVPTTTIVQ